jgi:hypothetical protein
MLNNILQVPLNAQLWYVALFAWSIVWKGLALWRAAHKEQKWWFMAFLIINTLGILEIIYLYVISVDRKSSARNV